MCSSYCLTVATRRTSRSGPAVVVDASAVANALADDGDDGDLARGRLLDAADLAPPDLIDVETVSVLRRRWLAGDLTARRFSSAVDDLADLAMT